MQLLGLVLLLASSWYIWKLTSKFLDEPTKKELTDNYEIFVKQFDELKNRFSKKNLTELWEKYKEERNNSTDKKL